MLAESGVALTGIRSRQISTIFGRSDVKISSPFPDIDFGMGLQTPGAE